ncbi:hypothetical protein S40288_05919 [Stachybotrys chartarum IBT 40288]|nr:hypothetical protein S40288_05919 [Stachybotrys chartarum IBT 40288]
MSVSPAGHGDPSLEVGLAAQRNFKKHKVLPRPQPDGGRDVPRRMPAKLNLTLDTSQSPDFDFDSESQSPSPRTLKHQSRRISTAPDLPPTPPAHSRTSSSSHSAIPSSPTIPDDNMPGLTIPRARGPATPPDQMSPPTPDVTPPQPANRPKAFRPTLGDRNASRNTTYDSRTESFKTAREEPLSSDEEDSTSGIRSAMISSRTSQATVRQVSANGHSHVPQPQDIDSALARLADSPDTRLGSALKPRGDFSSPNNKLDSSKGARQTPQTNAQHPITVRKRQDNPTARTTTAKPPPAVLEDNVVVPTEAARAARHMALHEKIPLDNSRTRASDRPGTGPVFSKPPAPAKDKVRSASVKSNASTVIRAILVEETPRRQPTLRHVRKQRELRESSGSSPNSTVNSLESEKSYPPQTFRRSEARRHESVASYTSTASLSSNRARREIWKNGAIPVVVIPDRQSSGRSKSSREPSLRSTSSRRSKVTTSIGSAPLVEYIDSDSTPVFERPSRSSRRYSESDGRDERTIDYPPIIPARSSSLSAPTSRNTSRAGSMTADSGRVRNALQQLHGSGSRETAVPTSAGVQQPLLVPELQSGQEISEPSPQASTSHQSPREQAESFTKLSKANTSERDEPHDRLDIDHHDDAVSSKKYSSRNTPFSTLSFETSGTAPEVSEAMAVQMYPHQNTSVLMVDHSSRPTDASDATPKRATEIPAGQPKITMTAPDEQEPVTPPQPRFLLDEVDSPLRNPRAPPQPPAIPPAINFIPATPSGLTPAHDKAALMGNYFETMDEKPARRPSLVRRAFSRQRRMSLEYPPSASKPPGFLTRTFSLSRNVRRGSDASLAAPKPDMEGHMTYPQAEDRPAEEHKLHPFWRPVWADDTFDDFDGGYARDDHDDMVYRYPPIDNRPPLSKRSLSQKMKRTFAILPVMDDDEYYPADDWQGPERRTIRRTPSGNLRVVRHSLSAESLRRRRSLFDWSYNVQDGSPLRGFLQGYRVQRRVSKERRRRFSLAIVDDIQNIPRRLSDRRRERRNEELRAKISGPKAVRDGVEDMLRTTSTRESRHDGRYTNDRV